MSNNTKRTIGFFIFLLLISIGINGYFVYDKYWKKEEPVEVIDNGPEEVAIQLDSDNLLVKDLYKFVIYENERVLVDTSLYGSGIVTVKDISDNEKIARVYKNEGEYISMPCDTYNEINFKLISNKISGMNISSLLTCDGDYLQYNEDYSRYGYPVVYKTSKGNIYNEVKKSFGKDINVVVADNFSPAYNESCISSGEDIYCISFAVNNNLKTLNKFIKALKYNDRIEIYNMFAYYDEAGNVFRNSLGRDVIGKGYSDALEDIFSRYEFKVYKHTFRMNNDGSYYWYSSEPFEGEV